MEEDPRLYRSLKTGRGPLGDDWLENIVAAGPLMCAYKLCKVEFRYWGMQSKIEQFIHDVGEHVGVSAILCGPSPWWCKWISLGRLGSSDSSMQCNPSKVVSHFNNVHVMLLH